MITYSSKRNTKANIIEPQKYGTDNEPRQDERQRTGRFRERDFEEEEYYRRGREPRYDPYDRPLYPPYTVYAPPIFPAPVYQMPAPMYTTAYPQADFRTPQFYPNDPLRSTSGTKGARQTSPELLEAVEKKLVFDVGTSPDTPELRKRIIEEAEAIAIAPQVDKESPERARRTGFDEHSFAASPSDKIDPQARSSFILLDPVTRAWVDALSCLENEDYQSAYEIILSTGKDYIVAFVNRNNI